jgi:hypothetical protein
MLRTPRAAHAKKRQSLDRPSHLAGIAGFVEIDAPLQDQRRYALDCADEELAVRRRLRARKARQIHVGHGDRVLGEVGHAVKIAAENNRRLDEAVRIAGFNYFGRVLGGAGHMYVSGTARIARRQADSQLIQPGGSIAECGDEKINLLRAFGLAPPTRRFRCAGRALIPARTDFFWNALERKGSGNIYLGDWLRLGFAKWSKGEPTSRPSRNVDRRPSKGIFNASAI